MTITREFVQEVRKRLAETPTIRTDALAGELHSPEARVRTALPVSMRIRARNSDFGAIGEQLAAWSGAFRLEGPAAALGSERLRGLEFSDRSGHSGHYSHSGLSGSASTSIRGSNNRPERPENRKETAEGESCPLPGPAGGDASAKSALQAALSGFQAGNLSYIWFVTRPELGTEGYSVQFFDAAGRRLLAVHLDCREQSAMDRFAEMRARFGVKSIPRVPFEGKTLASKTPCRGCRNCTCHEKAGQHGHHHARAVA